MTEASASRSRGREDRRASLLGDATPTMPVKCFPRKSMSTRSVEIYVSTDVETDGPIPGPHSMLSFGSAAYTAQKTLVGTFSANLDALPEAKGDPKTMAFWGQNEEA